MANNLASMYTPQLGLGGYESGLRDFMKGKIGDDPLQTWQQNQQWGDVAPEDVMSANKDWQSQYGGLASQYQKTLDPREWQAIQQEMATSQAKNQSRFNRGAAITKGLIASIAGGAASAALGGGAAAAGAPEVGSAGYGAGETAWGANEGYALANPESKYMLSGMSDYGPVAASGAEGWSGEGDTSGMKEQVSNLGQSYDPSYADMFSDAMSNAGTQIQNFFSDLVSPASAGGTSSEGTSLLDTLWKKRDILGKVAGLYSDYAQNKQQGNLAKGLAGLYAPGSPYAKQLQKSLQRKDAASGRRSNYAGREVELQAALANAASNNAGTLNSIYSSQGQSRNNVFNSGLRLLDMFAPSTKAVNTNGLDRLLKTNFGSGD